MQVCNKCSFILLQLSVVYVSRSLFPAGGNLSQPMHHVSHFRLIPARICLPWAKQGEFHRSRVPPAPPTHLPLFLVAFRFCLVTETEHHSLTDRSQATWNLGRIRAGRHAV